MNTSLSAAQQAQQSNRNRSGRYQTKTRPESDTSLSDNTSNGSSNGGGGSTDQELIDAVHTAVGRGDMARFDPDNPDAAFTTNTDDGSEHQEPSGTGEAPARGDWDADQRHARTLDDGQLEHAIRASRRETGPPSAASWVVATDVEYRRRAQKRAKSANDQELVARLRYRLDWLPDGRADPVDGFDDQVAAGELAHRYPDADQARRDWVRTASPRSRRRDPTGTTKFLAHIDNHTSRQP